MFTTNAEGIVWKKNFKTWNIPINSGYTNIFSPLLKQNNEAKKPVKSHSEV